MPRNGVHEQGERIPITIEDSSAERGDITIVAQGIGKTTKLPTPWAPETRSGTWSFAGGDIVTGPATVILAMGAGRKAARSIDQYLQTDVWPGEVQSVRNGPTSILTSVDGV